MLTTRQKEIKDFLDKVISKKGIAPTEREIAKKFKISPSTAHEHLETLEKKGYLEKAHGRARGIKISGMSSDLIKVPLLGRIAAGQPIEAIENYDETISIMRSELRSNGNYYALKVVGDSMIDDGIFDGDFVIIRKQETAENGQTVVAIIDENEATLKKIYKENGKFRLQPANPTLFPIYRDEVEVRGVVEKVIRNVKNNYVSTSDIEPINVLSLFDGISCARIALEKLGIRVKNYYSSEIDQHSIAVSKKNYPDIIQLGDITKINVDDLPKIDLLIGGSPCQDLSNAQNGLGLEGEKSKLFYEYLKIYKKVKPKYFLLENVQNKWGNFMSKEVGVHFVPINSSLFSAQSRPRYYWTNLDYPELPTIDKNESIEDILEDSVSESLFFTKNNIDSFLKEIKNKATAKKENKIIKLFDVPKTIINDNERQRRVYSTLGKSPTILARADTTKIYINGKIRKLSPLECERLQKIPDNYTSIASNTQRYKMVGNAFTVDTIEHLLKGLFKNPTNKRKIKS